jgi:hypothetical protein
VWKAGPAFVRIPSACDRFNPLNGSADVVAMKLDREWDTSGVGWVVDLETGAVYPGVVFNSAATKPTTQP